MYVLRVLFDVLFDPISSTRCRYARFQQSQHRIPLVRRDPPPPGSLCGVLPRWTGDSRHRLVPLPRGPDDGGPPRTLCKGARRGKGSSARAVDSYTAHGSGNERPLHTLGVQRLAPESKSTGRSTLASQDYLETKGRCETNWIEFAV
jgi:hypothetical protein